MLNAKIADNGHLQFVLDDGSIVDAGNVRGATGAQGQPGIGIKGDPGQPGAKGDAGVGIGNTALQNTIILGSTSTAPVVGTRTIQRIESQTIGDKLRLTYKFGQSQSGSGSGDYLLSLPTGIAFNTNYNAVFTGAIWTGGVSNMAIYMIPATGGIVIDGNWTNQIMVVPYDSTRFRLALTNNVNPNAFIFWGSGFYSTAATSGINLQLQFEIWK